MKINGTRKNVRLSCAKLSTYRELIKLFIPPLFLKGYRFLCGNRKNDFGLSGDYISWKEAKRNTTGYNSEIILEKTKSAVLKVKNGDAAYERDSVLLSEIQYAWPLLAGLMWVAARCGGG